MTSPALQQWAAKHYEDVAYEVGSLKIVLADDPSDEERVELEAHLKAAEEEIGDTAALLEDFELPEM